MGTHFETPQLQWSGVHYTVTLMGAALQWLADEQLRKLLEQWNDAEEDSRLTSRFFSRGQVQRVIAILNVYHN